MKYYVSIAVDGRVYCEVEARDPEEAKEKAEEAFFEADLGELECIDTAFVNCEDEDGNLIDY